MTFSLKLRSLPATITIDNFVEGIGPYSYELYLLELINSSQWARKRFGILSFIEDQSHGEADCKSLKLPIPLMGLFLENSIKTGSQIQIQAV